MKQRLKQWIFRLLGKDPEAVVVVFETGDPALCRRMADEVLSLVPDRRQLHAAGLTPDDFRICAAPSGFTASASLP